MSRIYNSMQSQNTALLLLTIQLIFKLWHDIKITPWNFFNYLMVVTMFLSHRFWNFCGHLTVYIFKSFLESFKYCLLLVDCISKRFSPTVYRSDIKTFATLYLMPPWLFWSEHKGVCGAFRSAKNSSITSSYQFDKGDNRN